MTQNQADKLGIFIDNMTQEKSEVLFEELIGGVSLYFGTMMFAEIIDDVYDQLKEKGASLEEIAEEVKKRSASNEDIYVELTHQLQDEEDAYEFAVNCVESIVFNPAYPKEITDLLEQEDIEEQEFSINLIVSFKDTFIDIFVNDIDLEEWKNDVIDALVASWDQ